MADGAGAAGAGPSSGELFTRGGPNVPDNRGQSMVSRRSKRRAFSLRPPPPPPLLPPPLPACRCRHSGPAYPLASQT